MSAILIRDLPEPLLVALKELAKKNHRSLQGELHAILEREVAVRGPGKTAGPLKLNLASANRAGEPVVMEREAIYGDDGR